MLCMYNHVLKAVQKHNMKRSWIPCAHRRPVSNAEISIQSALQQTLTTLKGCRAMIVGRRSGIASGREPQTSIEL